MKIQNIILIILYVAVINIYADDCWSEESKIDDLVYNIKRIATSCQGKS